MKKRILLSLVFLTILSCGDEVQFNTPAFQGDRENELWRAKAFSASIEANGFLTIIGTNNIETVTLRVPSVVETPENEPFVVGDGGDNPIETMEAEYIDGFGTVYSTNNRPDEDVSIYPELGKIWIDEIDLTRGTFTGRFQFLAFDASGLNSVGYTNGIFFKVPLVSGEIPANPILCDDVETASNTALIAYEATFDSSIEFVSSTEFESACNAFVAALNTQRDYCGDVDGSIQDIIDTLGNCILTCEHATANRVEAELQYNAATIGNYAEKCAQYLLYLQEQIQFCGDEDGSIQTDIDNLNCLDTDSDGIPDVFEDFDGDGLIYDDTSGDDSDGDGIANYLDADDDGDGIPTADEAIDANGNPVDTDGDGDVDYLDNDDDGDGLFSNFETGDTDGDGVDDYLDNDDDGDTILTIDENADPNIDGDPADAVDADANGVPDYLQA
ncbi:DUF6252 family protein [uncultured Winogradskyella sp.]|uniref:DUF6252 family protein n=1 Tax=uncultured Winogradskyella sp. TaxID=395353 RepID=UPI0030D86FD2|tara:strand:- start:6280 stop:7608 length:1329 start_codon:yes stop_codon:yes gene_type:complete